MFLVIRTPLLEGIAPSAVLLFRNFSATWRFNNLSLHCSSEVPYPPQISIADASVEDKSQTHNPKPAMRTVLHWLVLKYSCNDASYSRNNIRRKCANDRGKKQSGLAVSPEKHVLRSWNQSNMNQSAESNDSIISLSKNTQEQIKNTQEHIKNIKNTQEHEEHSRTQLHLERISLTYTML
ncbi:hypothetical protein LXL04_023916 [Taraxacum kok-saghyz]